MKLFYSPGACSLAPHIVTRELDLDVELVRVAIAEGGHNRPDYLRINPRARVPALLIGDEVITEAPAILVYLASKEPVPALLPPAGSTQLARCLEWLAWLSSSLHIAYAQHWRPGRFLPPETDDALFRAQGKIHIERMNAELESRLIGEWLLPSGYSLADISAFPFYRWGNLIGLPMKERYPRWHSSVQRMLARPAVQRVLKHEELSAEQFDAVAEA